MDLNNRHIAITGPTSGLGRATALALASDGARLTLLCRNADKGAQLQQEIIEAGGPSPAVVIMNMADLSSVRRAAAELIEAGRPLDVLLNNAGVVNLARRETVDGYEVIFAVNHLAPFLLTGLLLPSLLGTPGARIVNVASDAHGFVRDMGFDDLQAQRGFNPIRQYGRSKLANVLFTRRLARRLQGRDLTVNCLHPGAVASSLGGQNRGFLVAPLKKLLNPFLRSPEKAALTSIYLCNSEEVSEVSGGYFVKCRQRQPKRSALDDAAAERLWDYSEECVGFRYPV